MALDQVKEMLDEADGLARLAEGECDAMREELRQNRQANHDLEARLRAHYPDHRQTVRLGISRSNRFQRARMGIVGGLQVRTQGILERLA